MVMTRHSKLLMKKHFIVIIDNSGSSHPYNTIVCEAVNVLKNSLPNDHLLSLYTSNHRLVQLYNHNFPRQIPDVSIQSKGLSALYDNVSDIFTQQSSFVDDTLDHVIIISDNEDNSSMLCSKKEHEENLAHRSLHDRVYIIHPRDAFIKIITLIKDVTAS
jgi:hypothetical protein